MLYLGEAPKVNTVSWGFDVAAGEYDPATSPAAYADALAAKMDSPFKASDFTVTAVQNDPLNGPWTVSVTLDAGDNAAATQTAKDKLSATTPAELETALRLTSGSVSSITPATDGPSALPGDYSTVTASRPILPIPIALKDAPTWYESAYEGTDVATGATIGGTERLTWG
eukprot:scaffold34251_cov61-Phaeocystis_antarctica.AAC.1